MTNSLILPQPGGMKINSPTPMLTAGNFGFGFGEALLYRDSGNAPMLFNGFGLKTLGDNKWLGVFSLTSDPPMGSGFQSSMPLPPTSFHPYSISAFDWFFFENNNQPPLEVWMGFTGSENMKWIGPLKPVPPLLLQLGFTQIRESDGVHREHAFLRICTDLAGDHLSTAPVDLHKVFRVGSA